MSDCVCITSSYDDGDQPEFFSARWVTVRVEHRCYECHRGIWPRDKAYVVTGKWDGHVETYYFCVACQDIQQSLYCSGEYVFGELWDDIESQLFVHGGGYGGINSACLDKLATVEGKRYLAERWWQYVNEHTRG